MVITITAERHLHAASIPDGALLAELTFGAEVRDGGEDSRATDTCSLLSARGYLSTIPSQGSVGLRVTYGDGFPVKRCGAAEILGPARRQLPEVCAGPADSSLPPCRQQPPPLQTAASCTLRASAVRLTRTSPSDSPSLHRNAAAASSQQTVWM
ncbi:Chromatin-remodeling ATPase INO80 [Dissostichus eleginoides]|uniref:Chromatin-remodeling ATPase INO80 n=1 Tax=Dissostichus eleginoides TaxID=100907 RepID=A0AAD9CIU7_DISEL|nr:Chromatin-remodeling ATPase INO80 [Dissostichus eleginoides]